ncbi:glutaredoxin [Hyphobacterium sp. CCMP332]|nr:glutaredoxin [Hyphobacterium sp. CCMP332]
MKFHPNEIVLFYDPRSDKGKKTLAYAKSLSNHVNDIDIFNTQLTTTIWKEIINRLNLKPKELMDRSSKYYHEHIKGHEITMQGFLDIFVHNPAIIVGPIAMKGNRAILCKTPTDILKVT